MFLFVIFHQTKKWCGLDQDFTICGIRGKSFNGRTDISSNMRKHVLTINMFLFAFDTFCFLVTDVVDLPHEVQMVMHNNVMTPKSINNVFTSIVTCVKHVEIKLLLKFNKRNVLH